MIDGMCSIEVKGQNTYRQSDFFILAVVDIAMGSNDELAEALGKRTIVKNTILLHWVYSL